MRGGTRAIPARRDETDTVKLVWSDPKVSQPGKWRLIVDPSHPEGKSVNDGISPELCSLHYARVDDVAQTYGSWILGRRWTR